MTLPAGRLVPALVLLVLLAALWPRQAAGSIDISAVVGFGDTFRPGHWTPVWVSVGNRGGDVSGTLEVQVTADDVTRGRRLVTYHRRHLDLHRDSRKSLQFTVFPQALSHPLVIRVHADGKELARTEIDLRARFAPQRLLLVLGRNTDLDYLNDGSIDGLRILYPHPELLPAHWRGYDAVAAIVLHGITLERLSASQFEALNKWLAQGGILAVSGGPDYTLLQSRRLAGLLPGVPSGMVALGEPALRQAFAASLELAGPVYVNRLENFAGEVRRRANDVPLVVERRFGRGRVLYLTFDVARQPFARWDGMRELWLETLRLPATTSSRGLEEPAGNALTALIRAEAPAFPRYSIAFLFVALYLGLLFAGYALPARSPNRRRWALFGGFATAAAFAAMAWLLFGPTAFPQGASAATVALIEPFPGSTYARLDLEIGMYATRSRPLHLEYRGAEPVLHPHRHALRAGKVEDWVFGEGPRPYLHPLDRRRYVLHALEGEDVIAFHLEAALQDEAGGTKVALNNASGRNLEDLWLVYDGFAYALGALPSGARMERRLAPEADGVAIGESSWRRVLQTFSPVRTEMQPAQLLLERRAQAMGEGSYPRPGHALLIGYTMSPLQPVGASAAWRHQELALVAYHFASSRKASVPADSAQQPQERAVPQPAPAPAPTAGSGAHEDD